jgi:hypothetical protein
LALQRLTDPAQLARVIRLGAVDAIGDQDRPTG